MTPAQYCQCNSITASPCIVCGKPKFINPEWLKRKIMEDDEEGEIGAGFELFPLPMTDEPDDALNDIAAESEAVRDDEWGEAGE